MDNIAKYIIKCDYNLDENSTLFEKFLTNYAKNKGKDENKPIDDKNDNKNYLKSIKLKKFKLIEVIKSFFTTASLPLTIDNDLLTYFATICFMVIIDPFTVKTNEDFDTPKAKDIIKLIKRKDKSRSKYISNNDLIKLKNKYPESEDNIDKLVEKFVQYEILQPDEEGNYNLLGKLIGNFHLSTETNKSNIEELLV